MTDWESEAAALRAENERVTGLARATAEAADKLMAKLAAANALLRQVHAEQAPTVSLLCAIGDHLAGQPAAPDDATLPPLTCGPVRPTVTEAEQRVLEAMDDCPLNVVQTLASPESIMGKWTATFAQAELARREAK